MRIEMERAVKFRAIDVKQRRYTERGERLQQVKAAAARGAALLADGGSSMLMLPERMMSRVAAGALAGVALGAAGVFGAGGANAQQYVGECGQPFPDARASALLDVLECSLVTTKEVLAEGSTFEVGDSVTFRITVENTGDVPLIDVGIVDEFPVATFQFDDATVTPDFWDNINGLITWEGLEDGSLDPGQTLSVDVTFDIVGSTGKDENCALSYAIAYDENETEVGDEAFVCARITVNQPTPTSGGGPRGLKTPTSVPAEPTPVSTVAGAKAVPPQPTPRVGITLPDTGSGSGTGGSGETAGVLAVTFALVAMTVGAAWTMRCRAAR